MGVWSVGIVDTGVVTEFEAVHGTSLYAWDHYYDSSWTDGYRTTSHGTRVALTVEQTNAALERIDMKISPDNESFISLYAAEDALEQLATLHDQGWKIGAVNLSWTYPGTDSGIASAISALEARGIYAVAASGNSGNAGALETANNPAAMGNVISVGSHDGLGNPSTFSQSAGNTVHILADGENVPEAGSDGTSFAAPQVAAGVATVQALAASALERRLSFDELIDVIQQGGTAPVSNPDPADGSTRYYLYDHHGVMNYFLNTHLDPDFSGYEYMASHSDVWAAVGWDPVAARAHFISAGVYEGREVTFDALEYIASHGDLIGAFGTNRDLGAQHFMQRAVFEGRSVTFDAQAYLSANADLQAAFGSNLNAAARHYINYGFHEGRETFVLNTTIPAVSEGGSDLPQSTATSGYVGVGQSVTGTITAYDRDWFRTEFEAGQTVLIQARGADSGGGTIGDVDLRLRDSGGGYITFDYDSGVGRDALLTYTSSRSGTFFIEVDGWSYHAGTYTLSVAAFGASAVQAGLASVASDKPATDPYDPSVLVPQEDADPNRVSTSDTFVDALI